MGFFGCLGFIFLFAFIFVLAIAGSVFNSIWTLFHGGPRYTRRQQQHKSQQEASFKQKKSNARDGEYIFKPTDGEYIDFEEV